MTTPKYRQPSIAYPSAITRITEPPKYDPFLAYLEFELERKKDNVKFWRKVVYTISGVGGTSVILHFIMLVNLLK